MCEVANFAQRNFAQRTQCIQLANFAQRRNLLTIFFTLFITTSFAQLNNPYYHSVVNLVSYDTVLTDLIKLQSLGVKQPGTTALTNTKNWLVSKYQSFGYTDIVLDNFTYSGNTLYNIVVTKTGTLYPNTYLIVDGHYDTKTGTGTNDNGSGVSIILEIARLMANIPTLYSVKFINFAAEEQGLLGSQDYVNTVVTPTNMDILLVFNIDEVGGVAGQANTDVKCESDQSSPTSNNAVSALYTDTLRQATAVYSSLTTTLANAYGSDYVPFQTAGENITGLFETNQSSYPHTSGDNLAHLDTSYVYQIAKAATGAALYFAKAYQVFTSVTETKNNSKVDIFPNPFADNISLRNTSECPLQLKVYDLNGRLLSSITLPALSSQSIPLPQLSKGLYIFEISDGEGKVWERKKVAKL
ncbi:MAG: M28 family peptidase [Bacteroidota bacterium]